MCAADFAGLTKRRFSPKGLLSQQAALAKLELWLGQYDTDLIKEVLYEPDT
jgi:hypothetical protein